MNETNNIKKDNKKYFGWSPSQILKNAEITVTVSDKLKVRHRKALERKAKNGLIDYSDTFLPTFEICLKKACDDLHKCYNLKTQKLLSKKGYCDKLLSFTQKSKVKKSIRGELSKREINYLLTLINRYPIKSDKRNLDLENKLIEMSNYHYIKYFSVV